MKPRTTRAMFLLLALLLAFFPVQLAWGSDDLAEQMKSDYVEKVLTLRHFYEGKHLSFESDGSLVGSAGEGPWTIYGQVSVNAIKVNERTVHVNGRRVSLIFDSQSKLLRDELSLLAESKPKNKKEKEEKAAREKALRENVVDIDIMLTSPNQTEQDVSTAMNAVFLAPEESVREVVPDFWRGYFDQLEGRPSDQNFPEPVYTVKTGEVSVPRVLYQVDPKFSEESRKAKYQGTITLSHVVDRSGSVQNIEITSPLGMGLDEEGVDAVRHWRFEPAMKAGEPVAVKIAVEVEFHLY
jgi:TonB family protein